MPDRGAASRPSWLLQQLPRSADKQPRLISGECGEGWPRLHRVRLRRKGRGHAHEDRKLVAGSRFLIRLLRATGVQSAACAVFADATAAGSAAAAAGVSGSDIPTAADVPTAAAAGPAATAAGARAADL